MHLYMLILNNRKNKNKKTNGHNLKALSLREGPNSLIDDSSSLEYRLILFISVTTQKERNMMYIWYHI